MSADRLSLQLGVLGATHTAESVIALLTGSTLALRQHGRDGFGEAIALAAVEARALVRALERMADDNETARQAEYEQARRVVVRHPRNNITSLWERA